MPDLKNENDFVRFVESELITSNLNTDVKFRNITVWSSLNALILISRINEETGIIISSHDLAQMQTLGDIFRFINQQANGVG